jgi:tetratricopeptide (TPR) repeat protein
MKNPMVVAIMHEGVNTRRVILICLFLTVAVGTTFWQVQGNGFINFDDGPYVTANPHVQDGLSWDGLVWAFTTTHFNFWHPLTWLSHMLDCQLYGLNAGGHHFSSLLLHIANTLLLYVVLQGMSGRFWQSAFVAALFGVHPLRVESVAWVAERKDVLSTLFWMLTMGLYLRYAKRPAPHRYLLVVLSFVLGLMAKPMLVTLPFVLLLLDYWPLGRFQSGTATNRTQGFTNPLLIPSTVARLIFEKLPLFIIAAISSAVTYLTQYHGEAVKPLTVYPADVRIANALVSYVKYMGKMIWPQNLGIFYPHPGSTLPLWQVNLSGLLLVAVSILVIRQARSHPYLPVGWLWYIGTLIPVIGLVQAGDQAMADRFTYAPLIGLFIIVAWGLADVFERLPRRGIVLGTASAGILAVLMLGSWIQTQRWRDSITLFEHTLGVTGPNALAHTNLGIALADDGRLPEAIFHYSEALEIKPQYVGARLNLGSTFSRQGRLNDAIAQYREVVRIKPDYADALFNLGNALAHQGKLDEAIAYYSDVLRLKPDDAETHNNMGIALAAREKTVDAIAHFREALRVQPEFPEARHNLAIALQKCGEPGRTSH